MTKLIDANGIIRTALKANGISLSQIEIETVLNMYELVKDDKDGNPTIIDTMRVKQEVLVIISEQNI